MIFKQFKENNPLSMIIIPFLVGIALMPSFFKAAGLIKSTYLLPSLVQDVPTYVYLIASGIIISISSILIGVSFNRNAFFERNTFVAPVIFATLSVISLRFHASPKIHFANLLIVLALMQLFKLHIAEKWKSGSFNIGLLLGIAAILTPISSVIFIGFYIAITALKGFKFRESALMFLGGLTPFLYFWTFQLWTKGSISFDSFLNHVNKTPYFSLVPWIEYTYYGVIICLIIMGLIASNLNKYNSIKFKEKSVSIITILVISTIGFIVFKLIEIGPDQPIILIPFITLLLSTAALTKKLSRIINLLFYLITGLFICSVFLS